MISERPLALVYRGKSALPGCPEAVAELLRASSHRFDVRYVGAKEDTPLTAQALSRASLYVQPGGASLERAWRRMRKHRHIIRDYVAGGGRYLGFCLGGYLAGATPGFALLPGDTDQYIAMPDAEVDSTAPACVDVNWQRHRQSLYFQDGPVFLLDRNAPQAAQTEVLATYRSGHIAALTAPYGAGSVGVVGPHPEATHDWYVDDGLRDPGHSARRAGLDLIDALMSRQTQRPEKVSDHYV